MNSDKSNEFEIEELLKQADNILSRNRGVCPCFYTNERCFLHKNYQWDNSSLDSEAKKQAEIENLLQARWKQKKEAILRSMPPSYEKQQKIKEMYLVDTPHPYKNKKYIG